jgi:chromosome segregation ATPase
MTNSDPYKTIQAARERAEKVYASMRAVRDWIGEEEALDAALDELATIAQQALEENRRLQSAARVHQDISYSAAEAYEELRADNERLKARLREAEEIIEPLGEAWDTVRTSLNVGKRDLDAVFFWSCGEAGLPFSLGKRARAFLEDK